MSDFEQRYDQIERYIKNQLQGGELSAFEKELAENPALKEEVEVQRLSHGVLEYAYLKDMSSIIKDQSKASNTTKKGKWLLGLGVIVLCTSFYTFLSINSNDDIPEKNRTIIVEENQNNGIETVTSNQEGLVIGDSIDEVHQVVSEREFVTTLDTNPVYKTVIEEVVEVTHSPEKPKKDSIHQKKGIVKQVPSQNLKSTNDDKEEGQEDNRAKKVDCVLPKMNQIKGINCSLNQENGQLVLDQSAGLTYSVNESEFSNWPEIENLEAGTYTVQAKDNKGCEFDLGEVVIKQNSCLKDKDFVFNTATDRSLVIEIQEVENTNVTIINRVGESVYTAVLDFENQFEWEGYYTNGNQAKVGLHKVMIQAPAEETCIYNVVIAQ